MDNEPTNMKEWLEQQPTEVQNVAEIFPCGQEIIFSECGGTAYVCGYASRVIESGGREVGLYISKTDPCVDYDEAMEATYYVCPTDLQRLIKNMRKH